MRAEEIMSRHLKTCSPGDDLSVPAQLMWEHDIGCVPVIDERGHAVGIVTDRDLCMAAYTKGRALCDIRVDQVMATQLVSCLPDVSLARAETLMKEYQVRRILVLDAFGKLLGMISQNDLVREASHQANGRRKRELSEREVMSTLAAIGAQRHGMIETAAG